MKNSEGKQSAASEKAQHDFDRQMMNAMRDHALRHEIKETEKEACALATAALTLFNRCRQLRAQGVKTSACALRQIVKAAHLLVYVLDEVRDAEPDKLAKVARREVFWPVCLRSSGSLPMATKKFLQQVGKDVPAPMHKSSPLACLLRDMMLYGVQVWVEKIEPNWDAVKVSRGAKGEYYSPAAVRAARKHGQIVRRLERLPALGWPETPAEAKRIKAEAKKILESRPGRELLKERLSQSHGYWRENKAPTPATLHMGSLWREVEYFFYNFPFQSPGESSTWRFQASELRPFAVK